MIRPAPGSIPGRCISLVFLACCAYTLALLQARRLFGEVSEEFVPCSRYAAERTCFLPRAEYVSGELSDVAEVIHSCPSWITCDCASTCTQTHVVLPLQCGCRFQLLASRSFANSTCISSAFPAYCTGRSRSAALLDGALSCCPRALHRRLMDSADLILALELGYRS